jgi:C4-type Zn-finger protein
MANEYYNMRRIVYGEGATFVPVCDKCGRFVRADKKIEISFNGLVGDANATCHKCGRTNMVFEGFI